MSNISSKVRQKSKIIYEKKSRKIYCKLFYRGLKNKDFSIFSQNCWGGVLTQDLNLPYTSPTVNLFFTAPDFVKFCENPKHYLALKLEPAENDKGDFPAMMLGDIKLYFVHYHSYDECIKKWNNRIDRINWDNLFLCMTDKEEFTEDLLDRFAALPYPKVFFSHIKRPEYDFVYYIPGFENCAEVGNVLDFKGFGRRLFDGIFNPIKWLNFEGKTDK